MKVIFIILISIGWLQAVDTVRIKINTYNNPVKMNFTYTNPFNRTNYIEDNKKIKFFLQGDYPIGTEYISKISTSKIINGKKENITKNIANHIYLLLCLKENGIYFQCIEP